MLGNDDGGDDNGLGLGELLFGLWLWRELDSGRIDAGCIFRALGLIVLVLGGGFLLLLAIAGASAPRYDGSLDYGTPYELAHGGAGVRGPGPDPGARPDARARRDPVANAGRHAQADAAAAASATRSRRGTAGGCGWTRSGAGGHRGTASPAGAWSPRTSPWACRPWRTAARGATCSSSRPGAGATYQGSWTERRPRAAALRVHRLPPPDAGEGLGDLRGPRQGRQGPRPHVLRARDVRLRRRTTDPTGEVSDMPSVRSNARDGEVPVFYSDAYVLGAHAFDTTRKARWVAESLEARPDPRDRPRGARAGHRG